MCIPRFSYRLRHTDMRYTVYWKWIEMCPQRACRLKILEALELAILSHKKQTPYTFKIIINHFSWSHLSVTCFLKKYSPSWYKLLWENICIFKQITADHDWTVQDHSGSLMISICTLFPMQNCFPKSKAFRLRSIAWRNTIKAVAAFIHVFSRSFLRSLKTVPVE